MLNAALGWGCGRLAGGRQSRRGVLTENSVRSENA